jgi:hypothetical protein
MISSDQAAQYAQAALPDIASRFDPETDVYNTLTVIREYACQQAKDHNYGVLQKCFNLAETLYEKGSATVRCAVENVFVFSLSRILSLVPEDKQTIKSIMPASLQSLYMNQVFHRGY